jgi:hypothetical protein
MTDHLTALGHKRDLLKDEVSRLAKFPARVHGLTEEARAEKLLELNDELGLLEQEIQQVSTATQARHIGRVYGTEGREVTEDAKAELKAAQSALEKTFDGFVMQTRGYALKVHEAQVRVFDAAHAAGEPVHRPDMILASLGKKLGTMVEHVTQNGL